MISASPGEAPLFSLAYCLINSASLFSFSSRMTLITTPLIHIGTLCSVIITYRKYFVNSFLELFVSLFFINRFLWFLRHSFWLPTSPENIAYRVLKPGFVLGFGKHKPFPRVNIPPPYIKSSKQGFEPLFQRQLCMEVYLLASTLKTPHGRFFAVTGV